MNIIEYKTLSQEASAEYTEKKSRFIGYARPIETEEEAISFINEIKSRHYDARHNVYAYNAGFNNEMSQRYSDDGEPSGTAGMPVLDVILKNSLSNTVIVVTRYFGGILLGASGLVRAYGKAAVTAVESAGILTKSLCNIVSIKIDYTLLGLLQRELSSGGYKIKNVEYDEKVSLFVYVKINEYNDFEKYLINLTNGNAILDKEEMVYI